MNYSSLEHTFYPKSVSKKTGGAASQDTPNSAIAQNFQYINHPPAAPVQASAPAPTGRGHGHRHQQASTDADQIQ